MEKDNLKDKTANSTNTVLSVVLYLLLCGLPPFLYWVEDYIRIEYMIGGLIILMYAFALLIWASSSKNY